MRTVREHGYAKVNLFLDVVGSEGGYHMLDSVVVTIDVKDEVVLTKRNDDKIVLKSGRGLFNFDIDAEDNNAYKAAKLFQDTFGTCGVDITLKKEIPIGSGLGGSSADIAAVLKGMKKLFAISDDIKPLADKLGSDSGYLLSGGYARLHKKGDVVEALPLKNKLYMVIVTASGGVNTSKCFAAFDKLERAENRAGADNLIAALSDGSYCPDDFYNALTAAAVGINHEVGNAYRDLAALSPRGASMSGSGSSVFAIFDTVELCLWAQNKLKRKYRDVIVTESLSLKEIEKKESNSFFARSVYSLDKD